MRLIKLLLGTLLPVVILFWTAGCEREVVNSPEDDQISNSSCFTCHGEEGYLLSAKGEWENSIHASGNNVDYTNRGGSDCTQCHNHQGFLEFVATGSVSAPYDQVSSIHCFTCHAPHTRGDLTLRTDAAFTLANGEIFDYGSGNLCANCHHSRYSVDDIVDGIGVSPYWGPHHGPQGDLIAGTNGYEFDAYEYESTGHGNIGGGNSCVGCHMGNPRTHVGYKIGGHSFNMVDEESGATLVGVCQECHLSAEDFDYEGIQTEIHGLLEELETLLFNAGIIDGTAHPVRGTIDDKDVAGALFNFLLIEEDRSFGVHNPEYMVDLLESSISFMESTVGKIALDDIRPLTAH